MNSLSHTVLRRWCRRLHYWAGAALAVPFLVISVTGCLLAFGPELDHALYGRLYQPSSDARAVSVQMLLERARADSPLPVMSLQPPNSTNPIWIIAQGTGKGVNMGVQLESFVDPATGAVLGQRDPNDNPVRFLHRLHNAFLLEDGRQWVGLVGLVMAGLILTGLVVVLPPPQGWRRALLPRKGAKGARWLLDWHTASALWTLPLVLLITLTGITMEFPQTTREILGRSGGHMMGGVSQPPDVPFAISADQALAIAATAHPEAETISLSPAGRGQAVWRLTLRSRDGLWKGRSSMMVDAETGEWHDMPILDATSFYLSQQHGLHGGSVLGFGGRMAVLASGACQTALAVMGLLLWLRRQKRQRACSSQPSSPSLPVAQES